MGRSGNGRECTAVNGILTAGAGVDRGAVAGGLGIELTITLAVADGHIAIDGKASAGGGHLVTVKAQSDLCTGNDIDRAAEVIVSRKIIVTAGQGILGGFICAVLVLILVGFEAACSQRLKFYVRTSMVLGVQTAADTVAVYFAGRRSNLLFLCVDSACAQNKSQYKNQTI